MNTGQITFWETRQYWPMCRVFWLGSFIFDVLQMLWNGSFRRQVERAGGAHQRLCGVQVMEEKRESIWPNLSLVINRLPVAPRLAWCLLRNLAEVEAVRTTVDLNLNEMNRFTVLFGVVRMAT